MKYFYAFIVLCCLTTNMFGQHVYGTTGLLYAPTAEMQKDKTILIGGSMIDHNIYRDAYWNAHDEYNPYTYNYYLNITIFPWLEVGYTCTLVKGIHGSSYCYKKHFKCMMDIGVEEIRHHINSFLYAGNKGD